MNLPAETEARSTPHCPCDGETQIQRMYLSSLSYRDHRFRYITLHSALRYPVWELKCPSTWTRCDLYSTRSVDTSCPIHRDSCMKSICLVVGLWSNWDLYSSLGWSFSRRRIFSIAAFVLRPNKATGARVQPIQGKKLSCQPFYHISFVNPIDSLSTRHWRDRD